MAIALEYNKNQFRQRDLHEVEKDMSFAKIVKHGNRTYLNMQFEIVSRDASTITDDEKPRFRELKENEVGNLFRENSFGNGEMNIMNSLAHDMSILVIRVEVASKVPGGGT